MPRAAAIVLAAALCVSAPCGALAHHSFAMYDMNRVVTLAGAVKAVQWTNPHVVIWVETAPAGGPSQTWTVEATSPGNLGRIGWSRRSLNPGDKVEVEIAPLRDGGHGGSLKKVKLVATGQVLSGNWVQPGKP